jgi:hypothetical protein
MYLIFLRSIFTGVLYRVTHSLTQSLKVEESTKETEIQLLKAITDPLTKRVVQVSSVSIFFSIESSFMKSLVLIVGFGFRYCNIVDVHHLEKCR